MTFTAGAVSAANSTITVSPGSVLADGTATTTITVTAKDGSGNVIAGIAAANVVLTSSGTANTLVQPSAATDAAGQTTGTLASTKAQTKTVSVTINGVAITQTANVTFTAGPLDHFAFNTIGTQTAGTAFSVTITAQDVNDNTVTSFTGTVNLTTTAGTISPVTSGAFTTGVRTQNVTVTQAGAGKTITATDAGGSGKLGTSNSFTVNPGTVSAADSTITVSPGSVQADGSATTTITVTAKDANGNVIPGITPANVVLAATGTGNNLTQPSAVTDAAGQTTGTLASTVPESKTV